MEGHWVGSACQHSSNKNKMWWLITEYISCFGQLPFMTERATAASCFTWWKGKCPVNTWIRDWACIRVAVNCCADDLTSRAVILKAQMSVATVVWGVCSAMPLAGAHKQLTHHPMVCAANAKGCSIQGCTILLITGRCTRELQQNRLCSEVQGVQLSRNTKVNNTHCHTMYVFHSRTWKFALFFYAILFFFN